MIIGQEMTTMFLTLELPSPIPCRSVVSERIDTEDSYDQPKPLDRVECTSLGLVVNLP